jgi:hypothetical protein
MHFKPAHRCLACLLLVSILALGAAGNGCPTVSTQGAALNDPLAGAWAITRGNVSVLITWTLSGGGEITNDFTTHVLEPLNATEFPSQLSPIINQWNAGLADLNAKLDAAIPPNVLISFPSYAVMKIVNAADRTRMVEGAIDSGGKYIFIGDVSGAASGDSQGGGAILQASSIQGQFDRTAVTTAGKVARSLAVVAGVGGNGVGFTAQISVDYTGRRTSDLSAAEVGSSSIR